MRWFERLLLRPALGAALLAMLLCCAGCQTTTQSLFIASGPGWRVQEGQALWRPGKAAPELAGDLVLATHADGRSLVEFAKTPMSFVVVQTTRTNWLIRIPPRRMSFRGRNPPPARTAWLFLNAALAGEPLPAPFRFERKADGGWRLENTRSGESVEGYLGP
jgi:hypothetical protein